MLLLLSLLLLANKSWKSLLRRNLAQLTHSSSHPPHALNKTARFKRTQATMKIGKFRSFLRLLFSPSIWALSRVTMKTRCHASAERRVLVYTHVWRWKWSDSMNKCWVRNIFMAVDSFTLSKKRKKYNKNIWIYCAPPTLSRSPGMNRQTTHERRKTENK